MKLDTASDNIDLDGRKGHCMRLYSFICQYCGMVHIEGHANTNAITQVQVIRLVLLASWRKFRGEWYCTACWGMHKFVQRARAPSLMLIWLDL